MVDLFGNFKKKGFFSSNLFSDSLIGQLISCGLVFRTREKLEENWWTYLVILKKKNRFFLVQSYSHLF